MVPEAGLVCFKMAFAYFRFENRSETMEPMIPPHSSWYPRPRTILCCLLAVLLVIVLAMVVWHLLPASSEVEEKVVTVPWEDYAKDVPWNNY